MEKIILNSLDETEIYRYLGITRDKVDDITKTQVKKASNIILDSCNIKYNYRIFDYVNTGDTIELLGANFEIHGKSITSLLSSSKSCVFFCVTLGIEVDRLIYRTQISDIEMGVILDACATQAIEQACDSVMTIIEKHLPDSYVLSRRFSPGYGDLELSLQTGLLSLLDSSRKVGMSVSNSLMITPTKSVTAVAAVIQKGNDVGECNNKCNKCNMNSRCAYSNKGGD